MKKIIFNIVFIVFVAWIILAVARSFNNMSKVFTEEYKWVSMTDDQKRLSFFGDSFILSECLRKFVSPGKTVAMMTDNLTNFFYSRYQVYPTRVYLFGSKITQPNFGKSYFQYLVLDKNFNQTSALPSGAKKIGVCKNTRSNIADIYSL